METQCFVSGANWCRLILTSLKTLVPMSHFTAPNFWKSEKDWEGMWKETVMSKFIIQVSSWKRREKPRCQLASPPLTASAKLFALWLELSFVYRQRFVAKGCRDSNQYSWILNLSAPSFIITVISLRWCISYSIYSYILNVRSHAFTL